MKPIVIFAFLLLAAIAPGAFSQDVSTKSPFDNIETGTKKYYIIRMKDGSTRHARIISVDRNNVFLMASGGNTFTVPTDQVKGVMEKSFDSSGSIGVGFGMPYGILGFNLDIQLYRPLYLTGGIGTGIFVTPMYNVGTKIFLRSGNYKWRPRISAYYGTTGMMVYEDYSSTTRERFHGLTAGLGQQWTLGITKTWGIDFDILYIIDNSQLLNRLDELKAQGYTFDFEATGRIKVSFGLRYCF
jgi:hypothetical protein